MLSPDLRATLLDALRPEADERLDAAVATTFTLDLVAALVPPLAFASFALLDPTDPVTALEAVRACNQRIDVFCQAGQVAAPTEASGLVAFLEPMVHAVRQPSPGHLFHPKIWLLRYGSDGGPRYRLLCLTRNLTDDESWDAVLRLDGAPTPEVLPANEPLAALIRALPGLALRPLPPERLARVAGLAEEVRSVVWERPDGVDEIGFHVYGVTGGGAGANFAGTRHLVISPFCSDDGIARTAPSGRRIVVSRPEQLDRLTAATLAQQESYVLSSIAGLRQGDVDTGDGILGGLHAKAYVIERDSTSHLLVGSPNATVAAFTGNVEVLVELVGKPDVLGIDAVLGTAKDLDDPPSDRDATLRDLLEAYLPAGDVPVDATEDERWRLEQVLRDVAEVGFTVTVSPDGPGHRLALTADRPMEAAIDVQLGIELLTRAGEAYRPEPGRPVLAHWSGVALTDVTPFLVLRATGAGGLVAACVVQAELIGDPAGRHDLVLARLIDSPEKFLRFVAALLGLTGGAAALLGVPGLNAHTAIGSGWGTSGLFELLVRGLADRPDSIADLDRLVERLAATDDGRSVLPDGFLPLWHTVVAALGALRGEQKAAKR